MSELSGADGGYLIEPAKQAEADWAALRELGKPLAESIMEAARKMREQDIPEGLMTWPGEDLSVWIDVGSGDKTVLIVGVGNRMERYVIDMIAFDEAGEIPPEAWLRAGEIGSYEGFKVYESHNVAPGRAAMANLRAKEKPYYRRFERKHWGR